MTSPYDRCRLLSEDLAVRQNLEALGRLAGGIAHDFNNLMTTVFGHIEMARLYADPNGRERLHLDRALEAAVAAKELTAQLITFSIGGEPMAEPVPLAGLLEEIGRLVANAYDVNCQVEVGDDLWAARIDRSQMAQALHNIALNACEAMPPGGRLIIAAANEAVAPGSLIELQGGNYVRLSVSDEGRGIPDEDLPRIFDPYFSTKRVGGRYGIGLGLTIAHSIIKKHGGAITVESIVGEGTTVKVYLPRA